MNISNLQRAAELAEAIPLLDRARKALSADKAAIRVVTEKGDAITLPPSVRHNIINILNCEYECLREEARSL